MAINEAVELAKRFGAQQSASFVNGILDRVMHQGRNGETQETSQDLGEQSCPESSDEMPIRPTEICAPLARGKERTNDGTLRSIQEQAGTGGGNQVPPADAAAPDRPLRRGAGRAVGPLQRGLKRTAQLLNTDIRDLFKQEGRLVDDDFVRDLFALLIRTDMGTGPANAICEQVQSDFRGRVVNMEDVLRIIQTKLLELLAQPEQPIAFAESGPTVIMVVGVNGSGKTTSIAKLARMFRDQGKRVVLGAGDTFRAAAVEQLTIWAERVGAELVKGDPGGDPASVAHRAVALALESGAEVCIVDTAGRLQTQANLMSQLSKIRRVIGKLIPAAPHEVLLVLDATAGQNGISQAKGFSEAAGCTGIVLAKLDGTAKGGVIIPIRQQFNIPVKYVGVGEKAEDLALFNPERIRPRLVRGRRRQIADSWTNRPRLRLARLTRSQRRPSPVSPSPLAPG